MSEWKDQPKSIDEMRQRLVRLSHGRSGFDAPVHCGSLVRNVMLTADRDGLSGEDRYAMLAYHAIQALHQSQAQVMEMLNYQMPRPNMIFAEDLRVRRVKPEDMVRGTGA